MLSSELADLAGVTVRTLRHYHQIGLLPEPPRSTGGYRRYDVGHLVRLLRITRLTALGVPLSSLATVLDDPDAAEELLDELDQQASAEIERLTARRSTIAALRRAGAPPDLTPEIAAFRSAPTSLPAGMARYEHEHLVLAGHLIGDAGRGELITLLSAAEENAEVAESLSARFYALDSEASEEDVSALVDDWAAHLRPILERVGEQPELSRRASTLLDEFGERSLKPVQHRVLRRLEAQLAATGGA
ncbi:MerR family transcriptional regulator [Pseudonocardia nematodicida]|uniref:MerR family transcriptional regulator n=1 Tax=Pseudonocardia nematodicida TaxID=1206997 RepID=A0ABV1K6U4_9PSEU